MIQDIGFDRFHNEYHCTIPRESDRVFCFWQKKVLLAEKEGSILTVQEIHRYMVEQVQLQFLFSIDTVNFYLFLQDKEIPVPGYAYESVQTFRTMVPKQLGFAGITAYHLFQWYRDNRYCGRCGAPLKSGTKERVLVCEACGNLVYPKIAPAVIVGVVDKDRILVTRYANREYKKYALIAGFTEIGETPEDTVRREVMEEVGLHVKNIRYYKSQPWGFDSNLLLGFFCELDGADKITLEEEELAVAEWIRRDDMTLKDDGVSLTREMMRIFKENKQNDRE